MEILRTIITYERQLETNLITIIEADNPPVLFDKAYLSGLGFSDSDCVL